MGAKRGYFYTRVVWSPPPVGQGQGRIKGVKGVKGAKGSEGSEGEQTGSEGERRE